MISETRPQASVAITYSCESRWGVQMAGYGEDMDPAREAADFHQALAKRVTAIDAMHPREDLSPYSLVIAPRLWVMNEELAARLTAYVENGGTLCLTAGSGVVDPYNKGFETPRPGLLADLAGISITDLAFQNGLQLPLSCAADSQLNSLNGSLAAEEIHLHGAETIATHASGWRAGLPAITRHRKGKGQVIYVGVRLDAASIEALVTWLCELSGVQQQFDRPEGISVYERAGNGHRFLFVINWNDNSCDFDPGHGWRDAFSQEPVEKHSVPANDLRILMTTE